MTFTGIPETTLLGVTSLLIIAPAVITSFSSTVVSGSMVKSVPVQDIRFITTDLTNSALLRIDLITFGYQADFYTCQYLIFNGYFTHIRKSAITVSKYIPVKRVNGPILMKNKTRIVVLLSNLIPEIAPYLT